MRWITAARLDPRGTTGFRVVPVAEGGAVMSIAGLVLVMSFAAAPGPGSPGCRGALAAGEVVRCALAASPGVRAAQYGLEAIEGRKLAARTVLPSNPQIQVTAAARRGLWTGERDTNVYGQFSQEIEIAGQRRKRVRVADAEHDAQRRRVDAVRREVAAEALTLYFELLAARQQRAMVERMAVGAATMQELAGESAKAGLGSQLGVDIAATTVIRLRQQQIEATRRIAGATALLAGLLGQDPARPELEVAGELAPLAVPEDMSVLGERALARRAELDVARAEREVQLRQAEVYRRMRAPNPSLILYGQRDGFNERVLGGGISLPITLPAPLGRSYAGEIAEARARARQAEAEIERLQRVVLAEVAGAVKTLQARREESSLFDVDRVRRAEEHLSALGQEMATGRISIREAVLLQQTFLDLLASAIEARRAHAVASVELARAAGLLPEIVQ